eukprot:Skav215645  [mRNA]  locus=scaffold736:347870:348196:- [translate_table: standard]
MQWVEARASAEPNLLGDAADIIESAAGYSPDRPPLPRRQAPARGKGLTLSKSAFEPDAILSHFTLHRPVLSRKTGEEQQTRGRMLAEDPVREGHKTRGTMLSQDPVKQ